MQNSRILVALVKRRRRIECHGRESLLLVFGGGFNPVEVHADLLVRVSDSDVQRQAVEEARVVVVFCEIKSCQGGVGDGEFELLGVEYDHEDGEGKDEAED